MLSRTVRCARRLRSSHAARSVQRARYSSSSSASANLTYSKYPFLQELGLKETNSGLYNGKWGGSGPTVTSMCPATSQPIAQVKHATVEEFHDTIARMDAAKDKWANTPAPVRGEIVRQMGDALRAKKDALGSLVSLEMGKIKPEGDGEVQEAIDICDFATGLSRQLNGSVIPSERPDHFMMERYNPLKGHVGIISAYNFPVAVYFWNLALSLACGNTNVWKPATSVSLVGVATHNIVADVLEANNIDGAVASMVQGGGSTVGDALISHPQMELISFTGSTKIGKHVNQLASQRFGKCILELGGNNAMIVMEDADLELARRAALFSAVGTAGQRCTSLRRLYVQEGIYDSFVASMVKSYKGIPVGDPLDSNTLYGPLHSPSSVSEYLDGLEMIKQQGGKILYGGKQMDRPGCFVEPTIVEIDSDAAIINTELFVPILYVIKCKDVEHAIKLNNAVPQGLSSSLFTSNQKAVFKWTGPLGSDCGIVNVNIGPSGAEIGGAFGGEKETGVGRESGSDAWKQYMRRSTCTVNYGDELPLAQGINFGE